MGQTEGWPAGLGLAALALRHGQDRDRVPDFSGRDRRVADYLLEEVLSGLDAPTAEFLLRSSVLERMSAPLLDAVLGRDDSAAMLDGIERSGNLFLVPLDGERRWFRYHHLFREMLQERLAVTHPGAPRRLHARVSAVLEARGDALVAAARGRVDEARVASQRTRRLLARLGDLSPRSALRGYLALGQAALALGDRAEARSFADEAGRARHHDPSCTYLNAQLDQLEKALAEAGTETTTTVTPITAAELRILEYLPTHLTLREVAEVTYVSRNTVKSHTLAIYRKLGVSKRSEAVAEARRLGLLSDT